MKRKLPIILCLILTTVGFSQKKSELFAQIDDLKTNIKSVEQELAETKRKVSSSKAKAETLEIENVSLRDANATLLKNLSSFSELSKKNSENVNKTLAALSRKEKQLSVLNEMIASNDSTAIVLLSKVKQTLGEGANADVNEGAIVISNSITNLFGSDTSTDLTDEGKTWLANVAKVIIANPTLKTQIEGLNITGEFAVTLDQTASVSKELIGALQVPADAIGISVKDGNFKEGVAIRLQPDHKGFYDRAKERLTKGQ
ncbi:hypothetical protein [Flagellimonas pacifica]|uniref:Regulator of replication initiation timing n=1 Tax=Flagellimonas pacifica TaxID=1247520 RepID=A0A285MU66_9FLAO|nr:hypothetical protein [Allomuricauda parva]SNZ00087.1 Regulator of replication initiation timing [Allomuricauda parva]